MAADSVIQSRTIAAFLQTQARKRPKSPAILGLSGETLNYAGLREEVIRIGGSLLAATDHCTNDRRRRFAVVMPNGIDISVVLLAASTYGAAVPLNPKLSRLEFENHFKASGVDALVTFPGYATSSEAAATALSIPIIGLENGRGIIGSRMPAGSVAEPDETDTALVLMTSGSTGKPKIVPLTHRNVCCSARDVALSLELSENDRCLVMWEQFHIGGLVDLLLAPMFAGSSMIAAGTFNAKLFFELQEMYEVTWFQGVPTTLAELTMIATRSGRSNLNPHFRFLRSVAAALPVSQLEDLKKTFQVPVVRTLGMTEASPLIASTTVSMLDRKPGSVGKAAGPEVKIIGDGGNTLPAGETGQVAIRGENVFSGYECDAEANRSAFIDGWFLTGDLGHRDHEGDLFLTGRAKEIINRGGEKISPAAVDEIILKHPSVLEAASFSIPHARLGEDIACAVTLGKRVDVSEIRAFLEDHLASYKVPKQINVMEALPKTPVGKIDRPALASQFSPAQRCAATNGIPGTELEELLATIWKRELSLTHVGIDDDFASVEGDSLSAVRILVELETVFGKPIPNEIVDDFTTIRRIASGLDQLGFRLEKNDAKTPKDNICKTSKEILAEKHVFSGNADHAVQLISEATGRSDLELKVDYFLAHLPPKDCVSMLRRLKTAKPGKAASGFGLVERFRLCRRLKETLRETIDKNEDILRNQAAADGWQRKILSNSSILFHDPLAEHGQKTLVVGFSGNRMRLSIPTFRILANMDARRYDLLLLMDHSARLFFHGAESLGSDVPSVAKYITDFAQSGEYSRVVGIGHSGGSFAVLYAGVCGAFDVAVSTGPTSLVKHTNWRNAFEFMKEKHDPAKVRLKVVYGNSERQNNNAAEMRRFLPNADFQEYEYASKSILNVAQKRGELTAVLNSWFEREKSRA